MPGGCKQIASKILVKARLVASSIPDLQHLAQGIEAEDILVDFPQNRVVVRGSDILTRTARGHVVTPNLFFDPERWSQAYEQQKQCGFVFARRDCIPVVALAARLVFLEEFETVFGINGDRAAKTVGMVKSQWLSQLAQRGLCSTEALALLSQEKPQLAPFREADLCIPKKWLIDDAGFPKRLCGQMREALPGGVAASVYKSVLAALEHLLIFLDVVEQSGRFVAADQPAEKDLQDYLRDHLRSRQVNVREGMEVGGGETDLILPGDIVVENKVRGETADPQDSGPHYGWQARRYAVALCTRIIFVVLAYKPASEAAILPLPSRVAASRPHGAPDGFVEIRLVVPWGQPVPSRAKAPG